MTDAPYQVMPPLSADEYEALKADIAERGVQVPVEYDEQGNILDGHHRIQICGELGITHWPRLIRHGLSEQDKRRHARRLNLDRRHLDQAARRKLIEDDLREMPEASNRKIAAGLGVDDKTVGTVRARLEATAEIPQSDTREGRDGRKIRPPKRIVQYVDPSPEGVKGSKLTARLINEAERAQYREGARSLSRELSDASALQPTGRKFPALYADPAWSRKAGFGNRSYENHYPTMGWDEIIALPVKERLLADAWVFIWIPRAHLLALHPVEIDTPLGRATVKLPLAWAVAQAWGCDSYSTCFVWTKTDYEHAEDHGSGLIVWDQDEILLLFKRGKGLPMPAGAEKVGSNHRERPREHSRKPDFYRDMIRQMTGGDMPVLELFARVDDQHPLPPNWVGVVNGKEVGEINDQESEAATSTAGIATLGRPETENSSAQASPEVGDAGEVQDRCESTSPPITGKEEIKALALSPEELAARVAQIAAEKGVEPVEEIGPDDSGRAGLEPESAPEEINPPAARPLVESFDPEAGEILRAGAVVDSRGHMVDDIPEFLRRPE